MNPLLLAGALVAGWYYLRMRRNPGWFSGEHDGSRETIEDLIDNERTVAEARDMANNHLHDYLVDGWPDYDELMLRIDHMPEMARETTNAAGQKVIATYVQTLKRELPKIAQRIEWERQAEEAEAERVGR